MKIRKAEINLKDFFVALKAITDKSEEELIIP